MSRLFLIAVCVLITFSCNTKKDVALNSQEKEAVAKEVREMMYAYINDVNTMGIMAEFKYLDASDDFFWVPPGYNSAISYDSVYSIVSQFSPVITKIDYSIETLHILPLSKTTANVHLIVSGFFQDTSGVVTPVRVIETGLVIKRKDGWKLLSGQSRSLLDSNSD